jgi:hypothetical protein
MCSRSNKTKFILAACVTLTYCNPFRPLMTETITEGRQYAHYIRFPADFESPSGPEFTFDHLGFRISADAPGTLVVAKCGYPLVEEVCSTSAFLIDTAHQYTVVKAGPRDWARATPIAGAGSLLNPGYKPPFSMFRISSNGLESGKTVGWRFGDTEYRSWDRWVTRFVVRPSNDRQLIVEAGVDERKLPKSGYFGTAESGAFYGNVVIRALNSAQHTLVAISIDCQVSSAECMAFTSTINSRWFAVALSGDFRKAVLFDFGEQLSKESK